MMAWRSVSSSQKWPVSSAISSSSYSRVGELGVGQLTRNPLSDPRNFSRTILDDSDLGFGLPLHQFQRLLRRPLDELDDPVITIEGPNQAHALRDVEAQVVTDPPVDLVALGQPVARHRVDVVGQGLKRSPRDPATQSETLSPQTTPHADAFVLQIIIRPVRSRRSSNATTFSGPLTNRSSGWTRPRCWAPGTTTVCSVWRRSSRPVFC